MVSCEIGFVGTTCLGGPLHPPPEENTHTFENPSNSREKGPFRSGVKALLRCLAEGSGQRCPERCFDEQRNSKLEHSRLCKRAAGGWRKRRRGGLVASPSFFSRLPMTPQRNAPRNLQASPCQFPPTSMMEMDANGSLTRFLGCMWMGLTIGACPECLSCAVVDASQRQTLEMSIPRTESSFTMRSTCLPSLVVGRVARIRLRADLETIVSNKERADSGQSTRRGEVRQTTQAQPLPTPRKIDSTSTNRSLFLSSSRIWDTTRLH